MGIDRDAETAYQVGECVGASLGLLMFLSGLYYRVEGDGPSS